MLSQSKLWTQLATQFPQTIHLLIFALFLSHEVSSPSLTLHHCVPKEPAFHITYCLVKSEALLTHRQPLYKVNT